MLCQHCGYNLIGLTGDRCPECGDGAPLVRRKPPIGGRLGPTFCLFVAYVWLVVVAAYVLETLNYVRSEMVGWFIGGVIWSLLMLPCIVPVILCAVLLPLPRRQYGVYLMGVLLACVAGIVVAVLVGDDLSYIVMANAVCLIGSLTFLYSWKWQPGRKTG